MSLFFRPLLFCLSVAVLVAGGGGPLTAKELFLINMVEMVNKKDAAFLESLAQSLREVANHSIDDFTVNSLDFVRVDLNNDGIEEFIVQAATTYASCGTSPTCHASVYTKTQKGWRFVGEIGTTGKSGVWAPLIVVEDTWSNGWRITNNGEYRDCWFKKTDPERAYNMGDILGMPLEPGQAGYFMSVPIDETCPEK